nr:Holliday junction branch migration protein RuvA [Candidatus Gracilibacteria bacterium]
MISYLSGKVIDLETSKCSILLSSGIGYDVNISELTYSKILIGENIDIYVYHNITENSQSLYGFLTRDEKLLFLEFIKVSGVGGRSALNLLDLGVENIFDALASENLNFFSQAKGIGKKMAEKIVVELKDKDFVKLNYLKKGTRNEENKLIDVSLHKQIKISLVSMGYNQYRIDELLKELPNDLNDISEIIPFLIRKMN